MFGSQKYGYLNFSGLFYLCLRVFWKLYTCRFYKLFKSQISPNIFIHQYKNLSIGFYYIYKNERYEISSFIFFAIMMAFRFFIK
ncbi:hypothetical protein BKH45_00945 [Helicobacter sp. 11S03491-1]|nr:hypothetical protein BKH45_00945 [Helicobacter sp. 11S03491-1]